MTEAEAQIEVEEPLNKLANPLSQREKEDQVRRMMSIAQGIDPDAQQAINDFIIFKNPIERSNLPTRNDVHFVAYLDFVSKAFYRGKPNPFLNLAHAAAVTFMAKDGKKSEQFVKLMMKQPDLSGLVAPNQLGLQEQQGGILSRLLNRGKEE